MTDEPKQAGELQQCKECGEYSRARADAEAETNEHVQSFVTFIGAKLKDAERNLEEYRGNRNPASKLMASHYRSQIYAFGESLVWFKFYMDIEPQDPKETVQ